MSSAVETVNGFVQAFIAAWPSGDAERLGKFFAQDAVYHNTPLAAVTGRAGIVATLAGFMAMGGSVQVDMLHVLADGPIVMTERVDHFATDTAKVSLPVMGVFEVHHGLITAWRDYFDLGQFSSQMAAQP